MRREHIEELVAEEVEKIIAGTALELVDVEYVREAGQWYLRLYLDCQAVSEKLSKILDEKDPISDNYLLEVSSPGLDRVLKKEKDFIRYQGRDVDIHFFKPHNGTKLLTAVLRGREGDVLTVSHDETEETLDMKDISQIRLHIDF